MRARLEPPTSSRPPVAPAVATLVHPKTDGYHPFRGRSDRPTLYRERNGWCPYSERVWLALEYKGVEYDTVLIDNTGGGRPAWYSGDTKY